MSILSAQALGPPGRILFLTEGLRAVSEMLSLPPALGPLARAPRGDGQPVMVLPGFTASDASTRILRRYLERQGFKSHGWKLGRNLGPQGNLEERLMLRLADLHSRYECKISLVGQSLGGIYAREMARWAPHLVRQVITLGSPFAGMPGVSSNVQDLYNDVTGTRPEDLDAALLATLDQAPPVPTTAIYSKADGIVSWRSCVQHEGQQAENIEVPGSHVGMGFNSLVLYAVAERLAQPEGEWQPFRRSGWRRAAYPKPVPCRGAEQELEPAAEKDDMAADRALVDDVARIAEDVGQATEEAVTSGLELAERTAQELAEDVVRLAGDLGPRAETAAERGVENLETGIRELGLFDFLTAEAFAEALGAQAQGSVRLRRSVLERLRVSLNAELDHLRQLGRSTWSERLRLSQERAIERLEDRLEAAQEVADLVRRTARETVEPFTSRMVPFRRIVRRDWTPAQERAADGSG